MKKGRLPSPAFSPSLPSGFSELLGDVKLRIQSAQERDVKYLELSYNLLADKFYNQVPYATPKAVETTLEFIAGEEPKAKGADPKQFLDESLVREVEASGFIKKLYETEYR